MTLKVNNGNKFGRFPSLEYFNMWAESRQPLLGKLQLEYIFLITLRGTYPGKKKTNTKTKQKS